MGEIGKNFAYDKKTNFPELFYEFTIDSNVKEDNCGGCKGRNKTKWELGQNIYT